MNQPWFVPGVTTVVVFSTAAALLGMIGLLEPTGRRRFLTAANVAALCCLFGAAVAAAGGVSRSLCLAAAGPAVVPLTFAACRAAQSQLAGAAGLLLGRPRVQGALFLAVPLVVVGWVETVQAVYFNPGRPGGPLPFKPVRRPDNFHACTDRNGSLSLWSYPGNRDTDFLVSEQEQHLARSFALRLLRTAPPNSHSNCHGWVFCDDRFWVEDSDVEHILRDNEYAPVAGPRPGDLIVYRDDGGRVNHTGVVRLVRDGLVLIESKWGRLGRYLHAPADQIYSGRWDYYRSPRAGHSLTITPGAFGE
jgi:hypothetical protein